MDVPYVGNNNHKTYSNTGSLQYVGVRQLPGMYFHLISCILKIVFFKGLNVTYVHLHFNLLGRSIIISLLINILILFIMRLISEYGDIINTYCNSNTNLIIQQNNCTAVKVHRFSFAGKLSEKLPYSDPYKERRSSVFPNLANVCDRPLMGSISLRYGSTENDPVVCCCFAQYKMGNGITPYYKKSRKTDKVYKKTPDNSSVRLWKFKSCLKNLYEEFKCSGNESLHKVNQILIPGYIGCDRGGGVWTFYRNEIINFTFKLNKIRPDITVKIIYFRRNTGMIGLKYSINIVYYFN